MRSWLLTATASLAFVIGACGSDSNSPNDAARPSGGVSQGGAATSGGRTSQAGTGNTGGSSAGRAGSGGTAPSAGSAGGPDKPQGGGGTGGETAVALGCAETGYHPEAFDTVYDVGPGLEYETPSDVPWESIAAGTLVRIHHRDEPYRDKWVINATGTLLAPIVVLGVPDDGRLPVISGDAAQTRSALDYWNEERGIIKVGGASVPEGPSAFVNILCLEVRDARPGIEFTASSAHDEFVADAGYAATWVYGNVLVEPDGAGNSQIVHYGGDGANQDLYRKGTLYFYANTVVSTRSGNTTLLRLSTAEESAVVANNVLSGSADGAALAIFAGQGNVALDSNWLPVGWVRSHDAVTGSLDAGDNVEAAEPGFSDAAQQDFAPRDGSALIGAAAQQPVASPDHPVSFQYVKHQSYELRADDGRPDIGAFERR